jgi:LuxR family transcriptional regulator, maltose regulon positive regulatory protein
MLPKILTTKLQIPRLPTGIIRRPRLTSRLKAGLDRKLTVICAPAGYGKTTLLSEWLADCELQVAWLSLDRGDNAPERLYAHLVSALRTVNPGAGDSQPTPTKMAAPSSFQSILAGLISQAECMQNRLLLTLDNFGVLDNATIHADISLLLNNIPSQLHVIILSRSQPPLPLARLRVHDELNEFGPQDLSFTYEEARDYLNCVCGCELPAGEIASLHNVTEGWIDGLQMAARTLRGLDTKQCSCAIHEFNSACQYVADYFTEEVMNQQPEHVRSFLMRASILSQLNGSLCQAVTGEPHAHTLLEQLAEQNLFITTVDAPRDWYRLHQLFGKYLEHRLQLTQPDLIPELHCRASRWYERQGMVNAAIQHAIAGQDWQWATQLIRATADRMILRNQFAKANGRLELRDYIPESFSPLYPTVKQLTLLAASADRYSEHGENQSDIGAYMAGRLYLVDGQTALADQALAGIELSAAEFGRESIKLALIGTFGELRLQQGRFHLAAATYEPFLDKAVSLCTEPFWPEFQRGLCRLYYTWNYLPKLEQLLRECLAASEYVKPAPAWLMETYVWLARIEQAKGQHKAVDAAIQQALTFAHILGEPARLAQVKMQHVQLCLQRGDSTIPSRWARECGLSLSDHVAYRSQPDYLTLSRVLIRQRRAAQTLPLLERLLESALSAGRTGDLVEIWALQALAHEANGDTKLAFAALANALCEAEREGYVRIFVDEGAPMVGLLQQAVHRGVTVDYVNNLLALCTHSSFMSLGQRSHGTNATVDSNLAAEPTIEPLLEPLSEREIEVLRMVAAGRSNRETADTLMISPTTVKKHLSNILSKLNTKNRTEATAKAQRLNII